MSQALAAVAINPYYMPDQDLSPAAVGQLQDAWSRLIVEAPLPDAPRLIAGCDVHLRGTLGRATVVVLRYPELTPVETVHGEAETRFPYVPGLLSWRELPALAAALTRLTVRPDLLFADGQGIAHPRGFGLACHLGLLTDLPTLGCAKSILRGHHGPLAEERGATTPLVYRGRVVGMAVRSKLRVKPLYVSIGHRVTLEEATAYVVGACVKHRLPEPARLAHLAAQAWARGESSAFV